MSAGRIRSTADRARLAVPYLLEKAAGLQTDEDYRRELRACAAACRSASGDALLDALRHAHRAAISAADHRRHVSPGPSAMCRLAADAAQDALRLAYPLTREELAEIAPVQAREPATAPAAEDGPARAHLSDEEHIAILRARLQAAEDERDNLLDGIRRIAAKANQDAVSRGIANTRAESILLDVRDELGALRAGLGAHGGQV